MSAVRDWGPANALVAFRILPESETFGYVLLLRFFLLNASWADPGGRAV
jgi:hypothetical protein